MSDIRNRFEGESDLTGDKMRGRAIMASQCTHCNGTGRCSHCEGSGHNPNSPGHEKNCGYCPGSSGKCAWCLGKGKE